MFSVDFQLKQRRKALTLFLLQSSSVCLQKTIFPPYGCQIQGIRIRPSSTGDRGSDLRNVGNEGNVSIGGRIQGNEVAKSSSMLVTVQNSSAGTGAKLGPWSIFLQPLAGSEVAANIRGMDLHPSRSVSMATTGLEQTALLSEICQYVLPQESLSRLRRYLSTSFRPTRTLIFSPLGCVHA